MIERGDGEGPHVTDRDLMGNERREMRGARPCRALEVKTRAASEEMLKVVSHSQRSKRREVDDFGSRDQSRNEGFKCDNRRPQRRMVQ